MGLLEDVAAYLEAQLGLALGGNLFLSAMDDPGMPQQCVSLYQYAGAPPLYVLDDPAIHLEQPGLHVRCRAPTYPAAEAQAYAIWRRLGAVANQALNGSRYLGIVPQHSPFLLERDAAGRAVLVCNYLVKKE